MKLALLRHGLTDWNLEKRIQGRTDLPLAAAGRRQLRRLRLPAALERVDWYCSPLARARESAAILGIDEIAVEAALTEMSWGDWEGKVLKPLRRELGSAMRDNEARGLDFRPPGGESPREVQARLLPWLRRLGARGRDSGAVVHKGIIRCVFALASGWDMRGECPLEFDWDAIHLFELEADGRLLDRYRAIGLRARTDPHPRGE